MLEQKYFDYCKEMIEKIRRDEAAELERASEAIAKTVAAGGNFMVHDRGHLLGHELIFRAGGLAFVRRLELDIPVPYLTHPQIGVRPASRAKLGGEALAGRKHGFDLDYLEYLFDLNGLGEGDVLLLNTNSGYGFTAVAVAQTAKKKGMQLIVMSSRETADAITPEAGGKKVADYADFLFDNHAPYGDAVFELEGLSERLWPASGLGAAFVAWALILMVTEKLVAMGITPSVYRSANIPGGPEQNEKAVKQYEEKGY